VVDRNLEHGDTGGIDTHEALRAEMVEMFTGLADRMRRREDNRLALILRKMAATIDTVPYDTLAELAQLRSLADQLCDDPARLACRCTRLRRRARSGAHVARRLRGIDLDHPDIPKNTSRR
jgi:hypothetical protein